jgi:hypothetical protein
MNTPGGNKGKHDLKDYLLRGILPPCVPGLLGFILNTVFDPFRDRFTGFLEHYGKGLLVFGILCIVFSLVLLFLKKPRIPRPLALCVCLCGILLSLTVLWGKQQQPQNRIYDVTMRPDTIPAGDVFEIPITAAYGEARFVVRIARGSPGGFVLELERLPVRTPRHREKLSIEGMVPAEFMGSLSKYYHVAAGEFPVEGFFELGDALHINMRNLSGFTGEIRFELYGSKGQEVRR